MTSLSAQDDPLLLGGEPGGMAAMPRRVLVACDSVATALRIERVLLSAFPALEVTATSKYDQALDAALDTSIDACMVGRSLGDALGSDLIRDARAAGSETVFFAIVDIRPGGDLSVADWPGADEVLASDNLDHIHLGYVLRYALARRRDQRMGREREARYRRLFHSNPHPMWVIDPVAYAFLEVNHAAVEQFGYSREQFLRMALIDLMPAGDVAGFLENVLLAGLGSRKLVLRLTRADGKVLHFESTSTAIDFEGRAARLGVVVDVSARVIAETRLRQTQSDLLQAQRIARLGSWEYDRRTDHVNFSSELMNLLQIDRMQFTGDWAAVEKLVHVDDLQRFRELHDAAVTTGAPVNARFRMLAGDRVLVMREIGETQGIADSSAKRYVGTLQDVTEQDRAEQALKSALVELQVLSGRVIEAQEQERARLARELHDDVGQALTAAKIHLDTFRRQTSGEDARTLSDIALSVQGALETVRNLSLNLRPPQLDHLGLSAAIAWQAEKQAQSAGLELRLELDDPQPKPQPDVELACFRIVQEALANVSKHSVARRVEVRLRPGDGSFMLEIEDDGEGFDVKSRERLAMTGRSVGLLSMRERASLAGGQLQIDSAPGRGTRVRAEFPNAAGPAALPRSQA